MKTKLTAGSIVFDVVVNFLVLFAIIITFYPFYYVLVSSFTNPEDLFSVKIQLFPKSISLDSYKMILRVPTIWRSYYNTVWYTVVGTAFNIVFTVLAAYPLSRKKFQARNFFMFVFVFTMFFSGGLIPSYLLVVSLGLYNTRWAMIIPGLISTWNLILCRTFIQSTIHDELLEAAKIEGASEIKILRTIVVPLIKPILAALTIFYGVDHWNSFFGALLYLRNTSLFPLQLVLRDILLSASPELLRGEAYSTSGFDEDIKYKIYLQLRYAVIFASILPIIMVYPLMQKHFVKGIIIGSLKG